MFTNMWNPNFRVLTHLLPGENPLTSRWGTSNSYPDERTGAGDGSPRFRWGFSSFFCFILSFFCLAPLCILITITQFCVQGISLCLHHVSAFSIAFTHRMSPSLMVLLLMPPPSNPLPLALSPRWSKCFPTLSWFFHLLLSGFCPSHQSTCSPLEIVLLPSLVGKCVSWCRLFTL